MLGWLRLKNNHHDNNKRDEKRYELEEDKIVTHESVSDQYNQYLLILKIFKIKGLNPKICRHKLLYNLTRLMFLFKFGFSSQVKNNDFPEKGLFVGLVTHLIIFVVLKYFLR